MKYRTDKLVPVAALPGRLAEARRAGKKVTFTNGCFDVLHVGHVRLLEAAKAAGDLLIVAINSDRSVRTLEKGADRPIHPEQERAELLAAFDAVDFVTIFDDSTPLAAIEAIRPDVLMKGGDWGPDQVVGREVVESYGGKVIRFPLVPGRSTTQTVAKIKNC